MTMKRPAWTAAMSGLISLTAGHAHAHHVMDGNLPAAWWEGLLSGLGHPLIGPDHFAFLLAAALLAAGRPRAPMLLAAFVLASLGGVFLHVGLVDLPAVEPVIALSVLLLGIAIVAARPVGNAAFAVLLVAAGVFHGHAFGESIVGAERAPLAAYLAGLGVIQYGVMLAVLLLARQLGLPASRPLAYRGAGAAIAMVGAVYLAVAVA